ncbi:MAG TPA: bifunctional (p)ppGpp synthetase/guanosine-3',5'-bis(diphosphate) 3'-pyrophosphohydrolase [Gammaproteobacteria bacterium]|nr:bifunctional (p)ppGpp synthetase/guanosine-3',5'-bis(diphosphate) 3'-pyrophosphohydrolase [Gammaproteobacteria bacterium]HIK70739.1 bifunctional (p)ppGpp synthetase/guanosine-3',5'-bis(diphosphate) 3'-pyrophosphohydrolase [Pseudomonadales bacterium]
MVRVKAHQSVFSEAGVDLEQWLALLAQRCPRITLVRLKEACELSEQAEKKALQTTGAWAPGRSSYLTGLEMADILSELQVDEDGLIAAVIYRAVRENQITAKHVRNQFGDAVADLVEGVLKMVAISNIRIGKAEVVLGKNTDQIDQAKRMLVSLVDDIRVALIKLAERTCAIRQASKSEREKQIKLAKEISEIYAPLAHRLGIGHLKWELEDLSFRYLEPVQYKRIAGLLDEKRVFRDQYIDAVIVELDDKLQKVGIAAELEGRAKHICSIWRKMSRKGINFSEVYDVRAIRVLVKNSDECYRALGVVHNLWRNIPNEFDDYVANPKENGYQSLHTALIGPEGKVLEVQIRTEEMHHEAEYGVCAHWQYKSLVAKDRTAKYERRVEWLRQILEWQDEVRGLPGTAKEILANVSLDRIYIFTPDGHVVDMPPNATAVDFAYRVHTEIGHKCRGVKINGKMANLDHKLKSGDQVQIITGDEVAPRREWLHTHLGYVNTSRAKAKIQSWFSHREKIRNLEDGRKILMAELQQLGIEHFDYAYLLSEFGHEHKDEFFYALAVGEIQLADVVELIASESEIALSSSQASVELQGQEQKAALVAGMGDRDYLMAKCCNPVLGDPIAGIIDDQDIVNVHLHDCIQVLNADVYGRLMRLNWREDVQASFPVTVDVEAYDRSGLLFDITSIFLDELINIIVMNSVTDKASHTVIIKMTIEVASLKRLIRALELMQQLPNVVSARRSIQS